MELIQKPKFEIDQSVWILDEDHSGYDGPCPGCNGQGRVAMVDTGLIKECLKCFGDKTCWTYEVKYKKIQDTVESIDIRISKEESFVIYWCRHGHSSSEGLVFETEEEADKELERLNAN